MIPAILFLIMIGFILLISIYSMDLFANTSKYKQVKDDFIIDYAKELKEHPENFEYDALCNYSIVRKSDGMSVWVSSGLFALTFRKLSYKESHIKSYWYRQGYDELKPAKSQILLKIMLWNAVKYWRHNQIEFSKNEV